MVKKEAVQTTLTRKILLAIFPSVLILILVCAGELYCRWFARINFLGISRDLFVAHAFGDSYGSAPIFKEKLSARRCKPTTTNFASIPRFVSPEAVTQFPSSAIPCRSASARRHPKPSPVSCSAPTPGAAFL